jgi:hypothetical protein
MKRSVGVTPPDVPSHGFGSGSADFAQRLWWERRIRDRFFASELFGEPVWDLLLDLYVAQQIGRPMPLNRVHLSACVVPSRAKRVVEHLSGLGLVNLESRRAGKSRPVALTKLAQHRLETLLEETWFCRATPSANQIDADARGDALERLDHLASVLSSCREELDSVQVWDAGAHVSQALSAIEKRRAELSV